MENFHFLNDNLTLHFHSIYKVVSQQKYLALIFILITFELWPNMTSKHPLKIYSPNFDSLDAINPDKVYG